MLFEARYEVTKNRADSLTERKKLGETHTGASREAPPEKIKNRSPRIREIIQNPRTQAQSRYFNLSQELSVHGQIESKE